MNASETPPVADRSRVSWGHRCAGAADMKITLSLLLFPLLASSALAQDDTVRDFLRRWSNELRDVRSLRVEFEQTKTLKVLRRPRTSRGIVLLDGARLLMTVRGESGRVETVLSVEDGEARLYYPDLALLEIHAATGESASRAPFPMFGADVEALPEIYAMRLERAGERDVLVLEPRDPASPTAELRLEFEAARLVQVDRRERRGDSVSIRILAFEPDPPLPAGALDFAVPEGTRVTRPFQED